MLRSEPFGFKLSCFVVLTSLSCSDRGLKPSYFYRAQRDTHYSRIRDFAPIGALEQAKTPLRLSDSPAQELPKFLSGSRFGQNPRVLQCFSKPPPNKNQRGADRTRKHPCKETGEGFIILGNLVLPPAANPPRPKHCDLHMALPTL